MTDFESPIPKTNLGTNADLKEQFRDIVGELVSRTIELHGNVLRIEEIQPEMDKAVLALLDTVANTVILDPM